MRKWIKDTDWVVIIMIAFMLMFSKAMFSQDYKRTGNTFEQVSKTKTKAEPTKTVYTWRDKNGDIYPIYKSSMGACFILKKSKKTGKEYRQYLPKNLGI